jgi:hypothetical protein
VWQRERGGGEFPSGKKEKENRKKKNRFILTAGGAILTLRKRRSLALRPRLTIAGRFLTSFAVCRVVPIGEFFGYHLAISLLSKNVQHFGGKILDVFVMQKRPGIFLDVFRPLGVFTDSDATLNTPTNCRQQLSSHTGTIIPRTPR